MCRSLLWGSVLNHGAMTTWHFLIHSASYLIRENLEIVSVVQYHYMQICTPFLPNCNFKHTPYANHHRNTVQLVVPQAHCNQFKNFFVLSATERWNTLLFDKNGLNSIRHFKHTLYSIVIILCFLSACIIVLVYTVLSCLLLSTTSRSILASYSDSCFLVTSFQIMRRWEDVWKYNLETTVLIY